MKRTGHKGYSEKPCHNASDQSRPENLPKPFAEKLTKLRNERGLTQQEMSNLIGVGIAQIRRYEKGKSSPTLEVIKNIARVLGVSADELIFGEEERIPASRIMDHKLLEQFELVSKLDPHDKEAVKTVLESVIVRSRLEEIMPYRKDEAWSKEMRAVLSDLRKGAKGYSDEEIDTMVDEAVHSVRREEREKEKSLAA
jgi:transcriptional regulator with XRE-family HTH domain